jgi:hypothetical protein
MSCERLTLKERLFSICYLGWLWLTAGDRLGYFAATKMAIRLIRVLTNWTAFYVAQPIMIQSAKFISPALWEPIRL